MCGEYLRSGSVSECHLKICSEKNHGGFGSRTRVPICVKSDLMNIVAPGITLEDYESGRAKPIDLFQGQIQEWILGLAQSLAHQHERKEHAGIAVLLLAASVLEPLGGVLPIAKGRRSSEAKFCNGFVRVFGDVSGIKDTWQAAERVCELLRHGLFHEGFVKAGVVLTHQDMPIQEKDGIIFIDAVRFVDAVAVAFDEVCNEIRSAKAGDQSLQAFDAYWTQKETEQTKKLDALVRPETEYPPSVSTNTLAPTNPKQWMREM